IRRVPGGETPRPPGPVTGERDVAPGARTRARRPRSWPVPGDAARAGGRPPGSQGAHPEARQVPGSPGSAHRRGPAYARRDGPRVPAVPEVARPACDGGRAAPAPGASRSGGGPGRHLTADQRVGAGPGPGVTAPRAGGRGRDRRPLPRGYRGVVAPAPPRAAPPHRRSSRTIPRHARRHVATPAQWLAGARPRTLPAAIVPVAVGTGIAWSEGGAVWWRALLALLVALALQVGVNYANDYSDGVRGADQDRVGPMRLVGSGVATPKAVLAAALGCFLTAAVAGLVLVAAIGAWWLLLVGLAAILAAWFYTGGSRPYGYRAMGEVSVFTFFGLVAVVGTVYVQIERWS